MPGCISWMLFGSPPLLAQCVNLDIHLYYAAIQNLVHGCRNVPQITAESSDISPIHWVHHAQQSVNMSIQLPTGLQCDLIQMVQQEYVFVKGTWLYPKVNVANTVHLSKHHSYCLQSQNRGHGDRLPECRLMTMTNEPLRPGADQSSKAAFAKSKLTSGKSAFSRSRFSFRLSIFASQKAMVWPSATSKMLSAKTCQNVLESIFAFC